MRGVQAGAHLGFCATAHPSAVWTAVRQRRLIPLRVIGVFVHAGSKSTTLPGPRQGSLAGVIDSGADLPGDPLPPVT